MMLDCSVRLVAILPQNSFSRPVHSNIYIGIRKSHCQDPRLVLVTCNSITEFKMIDNIKRIYEQQISTGKIGIEFYSPPHQLLIKSEPDNVLKFLNLLRKLTKRKIVENMDFIPVLPNLKKPQVKRISNCNINTSGSKRPSVGLLPVKALKLNLETQLRSNLKILEMPDNELKKLSTKLGKLPVEHVNLENNNLTNEGLLWLQEPVIRKSLIYLNLSKNNIKHFPAELIDFSQLHTLNIQDNQIHYLPGTFGQFQQLRILNVSGNYLRFLPASITHLKLMEMDLTYNSLTNYKVSDYIPEKKENLRASFTLKNIASLKINPSIRRKLTYEDCPRNIIQDLRYSSMCLCELSSIPNYQSEYYKALTNIRFAITTKLHPQKSHFDDVPMRSSRGDSSGKIFLQYHFCTYSCGCNRVKMRTEVSEYGGYRLELP